MKCRTDMLIKAGLLCACSLLPFSARAELYVSIVQGLSGDPQYQQQFDEQRETLETASQTITSAANISIFSGDKARREPLLEHFSELATRMQQDDHALIYLIGHGSFDGVEYKFNLPGPDLSGEDFKQVLAALPGSNNVLLNTSSTSGAMLELIAGQDGDNEETGGNIVISATRNGNERNSTHFGRYFAQALVNADADLNKNNLVSVQEAFDFAVRGVELYFEEAQRLATEHAQLRGEGAERLSIARLDDIVELISSEEVDPALRDLLEQRRQLDADIEALQLQRNQLSNIEYLRQLQDLILQSAELSEQIDRMQGDNVPTD